MKLVLDGHDGCGKSTLARVVAEQLGGRVVKPFADTLGDHLAWLWRNQRYAAADALARDSIARILSTSDGQPLVFDRHWATMFTVLPEQYWAAWGAPPRTVICDAPADLVMRRLVERGEPAGDAGRHQQWLMRYRDLAGRFPGTLLLDTGTDDLDTCREKILAHLR
jgi:AAA domain